MDDENRQSVYPKIDDFEQRSKSFYFDNESELRSSLEKQKIINFQNDVRFIDDKLNHYEKLERKWKKINNIFKYLALGITSISSIGGVCLLAISTAGITSFIIVPVGITLASSSVIVNFIDGALSLNLSRKKIKHFRDLVIVLNNAKHDLYLFQRKALNDEIITDEELNESRKIVEKCKNEIIQLQTKNEIKNVNSNNGDNKSDLLNNKIFLEQLTKIINQTNQIKK